MPKTEWFVYQIPPIDLGWWATIAVEDAICQLTYECQEGLATMGYRSTSTLSKFLMDFENAKGLTVFAGLKSELRTEPACFAIPDESEMGYGFIFKEDDNGTTYVVSPRELPWLGKIAFPTFPAFPSTNRGGQR